MGTHHPFSQLDQVTTNKVKIKIKSVRHFSPKERKLKFTRVQ